MDYEAEVNRLMDWLETFSECLCKKRLSGNDIHRDIPECWDRKNIPEYWVDLCYSCRSRLALYTNTYPCSSGTVYKPEESS